MLLLDRQSFVHTDIFICYTAVQRRKECWDAHNSKQINQKLMICHACTMEENSSLGPGCLISKNEMPFCDKRAEPEAQGGRGATANVRAHGPGALRGWSGHLRDGASASQAKDGLEAAHFHGGVIRILPFPSPTATQKIASSLETSTTPPPPQQI